MAPLPSLCRRVSKQRSLVKLLAVSARALSVAADASKNSAYGNVVVIGGGAIGSLFAGRIGAIKRMKGKVWLLSSWEDHVTCMKSLQGLVVKEEGMVGNSCMIANVRAATTAKEIIEAHEAECGFGDISRACTVVIAVKQHGIRKAAHQAAEILSRGHGGLCVGLLNGYGHMDAISHAIRFVSTEVARSCLCRPISFTTLLFSSGPAICFVRPAKTEPSQNWK